MVRRNEDDGCHSEPEQRGGEESRRTEDWTRDSSAYGLRMTDPQNQCDGPLGLAARPLLLFGAGASQLLQQRTSLLQV